MEGNPRVLILGAGFGGLWAARELSGREVEVLVVDRNNYHTFQPLLYQVAAAELEPEEIASPVRTILRGARNVHFLMDEVVGLDLERRLVRCREREIFYDFLILALGSRTGYFGVSGAEEHSFPLKSLEDSIRLRNHILNCLERAALEPRPELRLRALTFTVVGAGPTGVEFAGALRELLTDTLAEEYPRLESGQVRVRLVEAQGEVLPGFPEALQEYAHQCLTRMRVEVVTGAAVAEVRPHNLIFLDGSGIPTETVVWTAGVRGIEPAEHWGLPVARNGCLSVLPSLQVESRPEVYVVGDLAACPAVGEAQLPMVAPVATQQGILAARNILRQRAGEDPQPFHYRDRGMMVTLGRSAAVADLFGRFRLTGFVAWLIWLVVHLFNLIGFRNRLFVFCNWAWDYLFFERTVKLILPQAERGPSEDTENRRFVHCRQPRPGGPDWPLNVLDVGRR